ncbi:MAG: hypothetical protein ACLS90_08045 [Clostridia bacterium]
MLYDEFEELGYKEQEEFLKTIDISTPEGRKNATDVINNFEETEVNTLLLNVPTLTEDDLVSIFQRFADTRNCWIKGEYIAEHPNFTLRVVNRILNENKGLVFRNSIFVAAAKSTEDEQVYNALYSLGMKSILNACKKNPHFIFNEYETLSEEIKLILFMVNSGDISENTGLKMMDKFNVPSAVIKLMLKKNPKWRKYILDRNKLDFVSADDQLMIANNPETDEKILYKLALVAKNAAVKKAILAHHNCTLEIARNMFK